MTLNKKELLEYIESHKKVVHVIFGNRIFSRYYFVKHIADKEIIVELEKHQSREDVIILEEETI